jgi:hypothetical protein
MARSFTSQQIIDRAREDADAMADTNITDTWLFKKGTAAVAKTWDILLAHGLGGEGVKNVTFNTVANQQEYAIGTIVSAGDFYKVKTLYVNEGNGQFRAINRVSPNEEHAMRAPLGVYPMKLYYIPCAPTWTTGAEQFDGINGYEEHTVQLIAAAIKAKQQDDPGPHLSAARMVEETIKSRARRSEDEAPTVVRRHRAAARQAMWAPYSSNVTAWDIRGGNIELFYSYGCYV